MIHEEPPRPNGKRLTLESVLAEERPAWADVAHVLYHYDGINCWQRQLDTWTPTARDSLPESGWWHRADCPCASCR